MQKTIQCIVITLSASEVATVNDAKQERNKGHIIVLSMITAKDILTFLKISQNFKNFKKIKKSQNINLRYICIFVQTFILAAYWCKFFSGCIFVQNSIQAAY